METETYSSINWALTTDPTDPLFSWDAPAPPESQDAWIDPELDLLLSASSYPFPEPLLLEGLDDFTEKNQYGSSGDIVPHESSSSGSGNTPPDQSLTTTSAISRTARDRSSKDESVRKRGRPRKLVHDAGVNQEERRRTQVRMAQRAYRSRKEASVSTLKDRISQLEGAVRQMSTAVISFGDDIVRSGALDSHPELLRPLGNTVQACLALPVTPGDSSPSPGSGQRALPSSNSSSSSPSDSEGPNIPIPSFIDRLHITCCYQAYLVLANPSIPSRRIERPFRLLLGLMSREKVATYFKDWLLARAGHKDMKQWDHIPFYRIGGAGTHYSSNSNIHFPLERETNGGGKRVQELASVGVDGILDGEAGGENGEEEQWFDIGDLLGYLQERAVVFPASKPGAQSKDGVCRLTQRLVRSAMCLGRSPGFRRRNVEAAVDDYLIAQMMAG